MFNILSGKVNYKRPRNLLFLFQVLAMTLLYTYGQGNDQLDEKALIMGLSLIVLIYLSNFIINKFSKGDSYIFLIVAMLLSIGLMMIYRINPSLGTRQTLWAIIGIVAFFTTYFLLKKLYFLKDLTIFYGVVSIILFVMTLILADRTKGSKNWISIMGFRFQPTEIIKLTMIFMIAGYYSNIEKFKEYKYASYYLLGTIYVFIAFLFLQRDLGTVLVFYGIFLFLQFIYEEDRKLIVWNILLFLLSAVLGIFLFNHVRVRILTWLDPWTDINNKGYQITQSLFAIGTGGFFGTGLGLGHPDFIPEVHTDFIFSAICEEMGVFTGMGVIMLFLILVYRGFKIAIKQEDKFFRIVALGISSLFAIQAFIILGGVMKMIPLTGITIPFVSYGGSSMLSSFISLGILQATSENLDFQEEGHE